MNIFEYSHILKDKIIRAADPTRQGLLEGIHSNHELTRHSVGMLKGMNMCIAIIDETCKNILTNKEDPITINFQEKI